MEGPDMIHLALLILSLYVIATAATLVWAAAITLISILVGKK
jgi:hypothetical protein